MTALKFFWDDLPTFGKWALGFTVIFCGLLIANIAGNRVPVETPEVHSMPVTVAELEAAYDTNEVAAQQKYGGQWLSISGKVTKVALDGEDEPFISFESNGLIPFQAHFDKENGAPTAQLAPGQNVTIYCNNITEMLGQPFVKNCSL